MSFDYLALLRDGDAELTALEHLGRRDAATVQPLVELSGDGADPAGHLDRVLATCRVVAGWARPVMVDVSDFRSGRLGESPAVRALGALGHLAERASRTASDHAPLDLGLDLDRSTPATGRPPFVPVARSTDGADALRAAGQVARELGTGAALRLVVPQARGPAVLARAAGHLGLPAEAVDLVVDMRFLAPRAAHDRLAALAASHLRAAQVLGPWRSTTVAAGSVLPFAGHEFGAFTSARTETSLWRRVRAAVEDPTLAFGDYGVVPPTGNRPRHAGRPSNPHPYLRYTVDGAWLVHRRHVNTGPGGAVHDESRTQRAERVRDYLFRAISRALTGTEAFSGPEFSWGDGQLAACAANPHTLRVGTATSWIAYATSHHLAYVARGGAAPRAPGPRPEGAG